MDVSHESLNTTRKEIFEKIPDITKKINFKLGPALETLGKVCKKAKIDR